ncbi:unnamed protein product [Oikopleura dioica]|uniref:ZP domain-containing protein n=1 Tax=Oikopleura dioica TaxID=34765 RepID=E4X548_OIKDI|nr:unnamed protein product [Oikopleura dioica]
MIICITGKRSQRISVFEAGKALVKCSTTGVEVIIDKCAVPGVDPATIHLKDSTCSAVEYTKDSWMVVAGFSDCGMELGFSDEKVTLENTLMLGKAIIDGRVVSRKYEIDFSCNYANVAKASSAVKASKYVYSCITFDVNDSQPFEMSFIFGLDFYKSVKFTDPINSADNFELGSSLFGQVASTTALPDSLKFSVSKCTVQDKNIDQSVDVLDTCPVEGINFEFMESQSVDRTAVKFSFDSFAFPTSAADTVIDVSCEVNICERVQNQ